MKEHPKYKGYHGTEDGNIISTKQKTPRVLKSQKHHLGYKLYFLHHDGKQFGITGHRFVAECFLPNPDNLSDVNHIDEDKQNCDLTGYDHLSKKYVVENVKTGEKTVIFNLSKWCKKNNVSRRSAYRVLNGDRNMTKGFVISKS